MIDEHKKLAFIAGCFSTCIVPLTAACVNENYLSYIDFGDMSYKYNIKDLNDHLDCNKSCYHIDLANAAYALMVVSVFFSFMCALMTMLEIFELWLNAVTHALVWSISLLFCSSIGFVCMLYPYLFIKRNLTSAVKSGASYGPGTSFITSLIAVIFCIIVVILLSTWRRKLKHTTHTRVVPI